MPGAEEGVDVYPGTDRPLDYPRYAGRLKKYGTALRSGESALVTKVKVKAVNTSPTPKTRREKNLEAEVNRETDPVKKRAIREELDDLKREREREDARNRSAVAEGEEHRKENVRQRRVEGGSRFNIRYQDQLRSSALTPDAVMSALAQYVDFGDIRQQATPIAQAPLPASGHIHFRDRPQRADPSHLRSLRRWRAPHRGSRSRRRHAGRARTPDWRA